MNDHLNAVQEAARETLGDFELALTPEERVENVEGWDSVATVQILLLLESQEGVQFDTFDVVDLATVGDFVALLDKTKNAA